ncbi:Chromosome-partitioning protein ParB [Azospirillaceae bacterium]
MIDTDIANQDRTQKKGLGVNEDIKRSEDKPARRSNLGRGLSALFGDSQEDYPIPEKPPTRAPKQTLPIEFLQPGRYQPRRRFDDAAIQGLVESIREKGVLQPLLVRPLPGKTDRYEIIAGERRWRAAQAAGLHDVPIILRDLTDREALEISLIENIQRQDLTSLEEAEGYRRLLEEFNHTQEDLSRIVGKSRSHIANTLRLLTLPEPVKQMVQDGVLTAGHARALITAPDPVAVAQQVAALGLNVRQTEELMRADPETEVTEKNQVEKPPMKNVDILALEQDLSNDLGLKVSIASRGKGGSMTIRYKTLDQIQFVIDRLKRT